MPSTRAERRNDFIGQFGIGLLSCFMVCDELLVVTRSVKDGNRTMEWRGRHDGTYSVRPSEHPLERPHVVLGDRPREVVRELDELVGDGGRHPVSILSGDSASSNA